MTRTVDTDRRFPASTARMLAGVASVMQSVLGSTLFGNGVVLCGDE
jgi:hypothetical protein